MQRRPKHKRPYQSRNPVVADGPEGILVAHYGVAVDVRLDTGEIRNARVKRRSGHVVGDRVQLAGEGLVRLERKNEIRRRGSSGNTHVLGVNLDVLGIVVAPTPTTPSGFIDRALVAARAQGLSPFLVANKSDQPGYEDLLQQLSIQFEGLIPVFETCAKKDVGLQPIRDHFAAGLRGAFVGTSGVGKSSLLNRLVPDLDLRVGQIREASGLGRHTTTVATLHILPQGGELVDTPGFREFGLVDVSPLELATNFPGFEQALRQGCRFRDCLHHSEPDCAVRQGVDEGRLKEQRYQGYLALLRELREAEEASRPS